MRDSRRRGIEKLVRRVEHNSDVQQSYVSGSEIRPSPDFFNGVQPNIRFVFDNGSERLILVFSEEQEVDKVAISRLREYVRGREDTSFSWFWRFEI